MGNRNSSDKVRRSSDECKGGSMQSLGSKANRDFIKSQSMNELGRASKRKKNSITGSIERPRANGSLRTSSGSVSRQRSIRRDIQHPISASGREIIVQCFENPHSEFANKTCQRVFEKRPDFQNYVFALGKERAFQMTVKLKDLVEEVVQKIDDVDYIAGHCRTYGEEHVELKTYGFKPDFWVALADSITKEGVTLDMANHTQTDTVAAWSQLVTMMFSSVRDGYYTALRAHRMSSRRSAGGVRRQPTNDSQNSAEPTPATPTTLSPTANGHPMSIRSVSMYGMESSPMPKSVPIFE